MKNLILCCLMVSASLFSSVSFAEDLLNGCKFNEYNDTNNGRSYWKVISKDNEGALHTVYWLKQAESGTFYNDGDYEEGTFRIYNTEAIKVCLEKKLNLPTKEEFEALRNCFEPDGQFLSNHGLKALYHKFPDMENRWFWSSSAVSNVPGYYAFDFSGHVGSVYYFSRYYPHSVRCVGR